MKKAFSLILVILFSISFVSCFEVVEKIKMYPDESGSFTYIINASKSKTRLNSVFKMGSFNDKKIPTKSEINKKAQEIKSILASSPGISRVNMKVDLNNYIIEVSGIFLKIDQLDNAIVRIKNSQTDKEDDFPTNWYYYSKQAKKFSKNAIPSYQKKYNEVSSSDKEVFSQATYTSILQFEYPIKSVSNPQYVLSSSKKSVKNTGRIIDFIQQKKKPNVTIYFY